MKRKHFLDKKFQHHSWFREGVTVKHALDYFAKCGDFYLDTKPSKKQSSRLFDDVNYDDILRYSGKEKGLYKLTEEEKQYFIQQKSFWDKLKNDLWKQWQKENPNGSYFDFLDFRDKEIKRVS